MSIAMAETSPDLSPPEKLTVTFVINGVEHRLELEPRVTSLLDALREHLGLTGTKKGCDHGQCGACTVHVNGRRVNSCLTLGRDARGRRGHHDRRALGSGDELHPVQAAFIEDDAFQCGYCTSGQIMSAVGAPRRASRQDDDADPRS